MEPDKKIAAGPAQPPSPQVPQPPQAPVISAPQPEPPPRGEGWRSIVSTLALFALAPIAALAIAAFVMQSYQVDGQSMETTLQNNDRLIVDKIPRTWARITHHGYVPPRGDIIIFNQSLDIGGGFGEKQLVKRVIGLPGERVVVDNGSITIYNQQHPQG